MAQNLKVIIPHRLHGCNLSIKNLPFRMGFEWHYQTLLLTQIHKTVCEKYGKCHMNFALDTTLKKSHILTLSQADISATLLTKIEKPLLIKYNKAENIFELDTSAKGVILFFQKVMSKMSLQTSSIKGLIGKTTMGQNLLLLKTSSIDASVNTFGNIEGTFQLNMETHFISIVFAQGYNACQLQTQVGNWVLGTYRKLSEMDGLMLSDFDDMNLYVVDFKYE